MLSATQNPTSAPILIGSGQHCHIGLPLPLPPKARWRWTCPMYRTAYQECLVPQATLARRENPSLCPLSLSCYCENRNLDFVSTHDLAPPQYSPLSLPSLALACHCPPASLAWWSPGLMPCSQRSQVTLPRVFSCPSTQGFNSSMADGRLEPDLNLCQSRKSDHFSLSFNFTCKGSCHFADGGTHRTNIYIGISS